MKISFFVCFICYILFVCVLIDTEFFVEELAVGYDFELSNQFNVLVKERVYSFVILVLIRNVGSRFEL